MMKRILFLLLSLPLFLMGCNQGSSNLEEYNQSELKEKISEQLLQPKLPAKLPFELAESSFDAGPSGNESTKIIIDFYGEKNEHLGLVASSKVSLSSDLEKESVDIGEIKGKYAENENGVKYLMWKEGKINYTLQYFSQASETKIEKQELIDTAKSFE
ncbi:DUF4367 domain-containing protein [Rossellomorea aquimaris]|uniref:DUF4367 domain-containing protein n=1 Tax=Rossellomorea aquimaris TaxID=189382 RepID=UPI001CD3EF4B|nr:DUF4367 domain-containing protein [Rossellomorea aquimaris]MCA1054817.1 DUF4367 domain-containing protein [Rossellomorea aquimaris]